MLRSYFAALAALLLLFPTLMLVPSLVVPFHSAFQETAAGPVSTTDSDARESSVELNMVRFSPSYMTSSGIYYVARRGTSTVAYFGESEICYVAGETLLRLGFPGSERVIPAAEEPTGSVTNYMFGSKPSSWRTGLQDCAVLRYAGIYPGIDLVYRVVDGSLKYEFVVAPLANPEIIRLNYPDAHLLDVHNNRVTISRADFQIEDTGLWAFQTGSQSQTVHCAFHRYGELTIGFHVEQYDTSLELVIDPTIRLVYGTFFGGSTDNEGDAIAVDRGFMYVTGSTQSPEFPTANAYDSMFNGFVDCFVVKVAADGQSLVYSTFLGGAGFEAPSGIAVENGFAYIMGVTLSSDFPTVSAYDSTFNGGFDCFVAKLAADGQSLVYSTYLGGSSIDGGVDIAVESGCVYVAGDTNSSDFPAVNPYDATPNGSYDCYVTKLAADGQSLVYSTYLGGSSWDAGYDVVVEDGSAYVVGSTWSSDFPTVNAYDSTQNGLADCFVTEFSTNGSLLVYSTFLGGALGDWGCSIATGSGSLCITGFTYSSDFPTVDAYDSTHNGDVDCFVTMLTTDAQPLLYSTFVGGSLDEQPTAIAVENNSMYITGATWSPDFPTVNAYDSVYNGGEDCFVLEIASDGQSLAYSTYLGGVSDEQGVSIAVQSGCAYVTGYTLSSDFPTATSYNATHNGIYDCFLAVLALDTDSDGLSDWHEANHGTDPLCIDSDNDNFLDGYEVAYGSDPMDPMSYPAMPQAWYDAIYEDLDGNATLIQYLITWSNGNSTLLQMVMEQLDDNSTLLQQAIAWLDGNHTAIERLFTYLNGNATLLIQTVNAVNENSTQLDLLAALVTQDAEALSALNTSYIGDMAEIRVVLEMLGVSVGDSDCDGLDDLDEIALGTDILCIDTDCDNLNDAYEVKIGTDPTDDDSDNDTYYDGAEVLAGTDPLDSLDYPGGTSTTTTTTVPPPGMELLVVAGAAGCIGLVALLVVLRRRVGAKAQG